MVNVYIALINKGIRTIESVPIEIREEVIKEMEKREMVI